MGKLKSEVFIYLCLQLLSELEYFTLFEKHSLWPFYGYLSFLNQTNIDPKNGDFCKNAMEHFGWGHGWMLTSVNICANHLIDTEKCLKQKFLQIGFPTKNLKSSNLSGKRLA